MHDKKENVFSGNLIFVEKSFKVVREGYYSGKETEERLCTIYHGLNEKK